MVGSLPPLPDFHPTMAGLSWDWDEVNERMREMEEKEEKDKEKSKRKLLEMEGELPDHVRASMLMLDPWPSRAHNGTTVAPALCVEVS